MGVLIEDIIVRESVNDELRKISTKYWQGNNLFTLSQPEAVYKKEFEINEHENIYLAIVASIPKKNVIPLKQEIALPYLESDDGDFWQASGASPAFPFYGWDWNHSNNGSSWTYYFKVTPDMLGKSLRAMHQKLAHRLICRLYPILSNR